MVSDIIIPGKQKIHLTNNFTFHHKIFACLKFQDGTSVCRIYLFSIFQAVMREVTSEEDWCGWWNCWNISFCFEQNLPYD